MRQRQASLATGVFRFIVALAFFALLYGALNIFVPDLFNGLGLSAQGQQLSQTQQYVFTAWKNLPVIAVVVLSIGLITRAAFESRGGA
uniref:Hypothetical membrane protein n=1 Tax=uncultured virus TaxID=340016 RepID=D5L2F8_9VIRU|nr:hypothetical membrane protein [uncultured virus]